MLRLRSLLTLFLPLVMVAANAAAQNLDGVLRQLGQSRSVVGSDASKSYRLLFDAYLKMTPPPMPVGQDFNQATIHPGMRNWTEVTAWAESNPGMGEAIREARGRALFGLPYGRTNVPANYREAGLFAEIGVDGNLRIHDFGWLKGIDVISAYAIAESYRLLEADRFDDAFSLAVAHIFVMRQCCDREFMAEMFYTLPLLTEALANLRDLAWVSLERVTPGTLADIARNDLPFLRPDRNRLFMPEGDRIVAEALITDLFDGRTGQADRDRFAETFAAIQAESEPFTRFGAARRWRLVADLHDSRETSLERLKLVYDDWWRRWRVEEYDPILAIPTQFSRTNPVRYAAVVFSLQDLDELFTLRNILVASVNGTSMAMGVAAYERSLGTYPNTQAAIYGQQVRKRSDRDPFDKQYDRFKYYVASGPVAIDTPYGRVEIPKGTGILYSRGQDHADNRGAQHTDDGLVGDIVFWPAMKAVERAAGLRD